MPLYEYRCSKCGHKFETLVRSSGDAAPKCPACGSDAVGKTVGGFGIGVTAGRVSPAPRLGLG
jgi:putative FmdB family regulatory protein